MANAEREPKTRIWGRSPQQSLDRFPDQGVDGEACWSWMHFSFLKCKWCANLSICYSVDGSSRPWCLKEALLRFCRLNKELFHVWNRSLFCRKLVSESARSLAAISAKYNMMVSLAWMSFWLGQPFSCSLHCGRHVANIWLRSRKAT